MVYYSLLLALRLNFASHNFRASHFNLPKRCIASIPYASKMSFCCVTIVIQMFDIAKGILLSYIHDSKITQTCFYKRIASQFL